MRFRGEILEDKNEPEIPLSMRQLQGQDGHVGELDICFRKQPMWVVCVQIVHVVERPVDGQLDCQKHFKL